MRNGGLPGFVMWGSCIGGAKAQFAWIQDEGGESRVGSGEDINLGGKDNLGMYHYQVRWGHLLQRFGWPGAITPHCVKCVCHRQHVKFQLDWLINS